MSALSSNYFSRLLQPSELQAADIARPMSAGSAWVAGAGPDIEERDDVVTVSSQGEPLDILSAPYGKGLSSSATPAISSADRLNPVETGPASRQYAPERAPLSGAALESGHAEQRRSPATSQASATSARIDSVDSAAEQPRWSSTSDEVPELSTRPATAPVREHQAGPAPASGATAHLSQPQTARPDLAKPEAEATTPPAAREILGQVLRWVAASPDPAISSTTEVVANTPNIVRQPLQSAFSAEPPASGSNTPPQAVRSPSLAPVSHPSGSTPSGINPNGAGRTAAGEPVAALEEVVRLSIGEIRVRVEPLAAPEPVQPAPSPAGPLASPFATATGLRRRCIHL
jgi:hypothetical protein